MSAEPDYFVWFDPHARIAALQASLLYARADGQNDILGRLGRDLDGSLAERIRQEVDAFARDVARDIVGPRAMQDLPEALLKRQQAEALVRAMSMVILRPMMGVGRPTVDLIARPFGGEINIEVRVGTIREFQYAVQLPPETMRDR